MPSPDPARPRILARRDLVLSPYVTLMAREVAGNDRLAPAVFHSLRQADYVSVLAETPAGDVILVEQFRPALETTTLELPGGLLGPGEDPAACAARELAEETGFVASEGLVSLGVLAADTGRLENRLRCFHARGLAPLPGWQPEPGIARVLMPKAQFKDAILSGRFEHALHVAIVGLAMLHGRF
ncbi:MAG: NUDIX hydrolase [Pseudomonadota bacterium]